MSSKSKTHHPRTVWRIAKQGNVSLEEAERILEEKKRENYEWFNATALGESCVHFSCLVPPICHL